MGINVPRTRFLPVKSTSDLFLIQSNLFRLKHGRHGSQPPTAPTFPANRTHPHRADPANLPPNPHPPIPSHRPSVVPNQDREFPNSVPLVKLGLEFQNVEEYERRFKGPVDVRELDHLTVAGDVTFGHSVALRVRRALLRWGGVCCGVLGWAALRWGGCAALGCLTPWLWPCAGHGDHRGE